MAAGQESSAAVRCLTAAHLVEVAGVLRAAATAGTAEAHRVAERHRRSVEAVALGEVALPAGVSGRTPMRGRAQGDAATTKCGSEPLICDLDQIGRRLLQPSAFLSSGRTHAGLQPIEICVAARFDR